MKFRVHPLFFVLALLLTAFGQGLNFAWTFACLVLHELAHAAAARLRGYAVKSVVLMPYGAMMSVEESFDRTSSVLVGLAGPAVNLLLAAMTMGLWWLFPNTYDATQTFFEANLALGLFNLLPVYPLDGSRIVLGISKNRLKAIKGLQVAGVAVSLVFFALFVASFFFGFNLTLGVAAVFLFHGAAFGTREEMYVSVLDGAAKNYDIGVQSVKVAISQEAPIVRLFHHISSRTETEFDIVDADKKIVAHITEAQLKQLALSNRLSVKVGRALKLPTALAAKSTVDENAKKRSLKALAPGRGKAWRKGRKAQSLF